MLLKRIFNHRKPTKGYITVVSGLPRSGTSMMMQILKAGGLSPVSDEIRSADISNTNGYFEHEAVKALAHGNIECLLNADGRAIKIISSLLKFLPLERQYKVIFMHRDINEVVESQTKMLLALNKPSDNDNDEQIKSLYLKHINNIKKWIEHQSNIEVLHLNYDEMLNEPEINTHRILDFLNLTLNSKKTFSEMIDCVQSGMRHNFSEKTVV